MNLKGILTIHWLLLGIGKRSYRASSHSTLSYQFGSFLDLYIFVTSLGGGVASALAAMWQRRFPACRAIGYGSFASFPLDTKNFGDITTVEVAGDPAATWSIGHMRSSLIAIEKLCQDTELRRKIMNATDTNSSGYDPVWSTTTLADLRRKMKCEKLYPPGKIYQISAPLIGSGSMMGDDTTMIKHITDTSAALKEWKVQSRMFDVSLHMPLRYSILLDRLADSSKNGK